MKAALIEAQDRLTALRAQHERAVADASQPDPTADLVAELQDEIEDVKADAYLSGKRPDVSKLEARIAAARKQGAEAIATRDAAQAAVPVLAERIAAAEAQLRELTLDHYSAALNAELAGYRSDLAGYDEHAKALLDALAKLQARAHIVNLLSTRVGRRSGELEFVTNLLVHALQLPLEVRPETWFTVSAWDAVAEKGRPLVSRRVGELAADGIDLVGPSLVQRQEVAKPTTSGEQGVRIVVDGQAEATGPRVVVAGLVESVTH